MKNPTQFPPFVCPTHATVLADEADSLRCPYGHGFPKIRGIPRFVEGSSYADAFGAQWLRYRHIELDSVTGRSDTLDRLRRCLGDKLWTNLAGLNVLECGCGAGRFTEILLQQGAAVTAVDLSAAVEANRDNCGKSPHYRIAQADIRTLPFPEKAFDVVLCLGVVQHTPNPEKTIETLYRHVAANGALVIDHYARSLGWFLSMKPLYRAWLKRLPSAKALPISERMVDFFLPLHRRAGSSRILQSLLARFSPVMHLYRYMHEEVSEEQHRQWSLLLTHDSLTDWYKHRRSREEIRTTLELLGLVGIWCENGGNGVEARGWRPALPSASRMGH